MKKILLSLALLLTLVVANAETVTSTQTTGARFQLLSAGGKIVESITVIPNGTNTVLRVYDSASTNVSYVTAAYTTYVPTTASVVTTWVGETGVTNSFTNSAIIMATNTVSAATNTYPTVAVNVTPSGTVGTFTDKLLISRGMVISNDVACTVIVKYQSN